MKSDSFLQEYIAYRSGFEPAIEIEVKWVPIGNSEMLANEAPVPLITDEQIKEYERLIYETVHYEKVIAKMRTSKFYGFLERILGYHRLYKYRLARV